MDIENLLISKSDNHHYIKKYIKFIEGCKNKNFGNIGYMELHHILPKAKTLFPEYINLVTHNWNGIYLTAKQHIIAHIILSKIFPESQLMALECMLGCYNANTNPNSLSGRKIPSKYDLNYIAKLRQKRGQSRIGKSTYLDKDGNKYFLKNDDSLIKELDLVGNNKGKVFSEQQRKNLSDYIF